MMDNVKIDCTKLIPATEVNEDDTYVDPDDGGLRHCKICGERRETWWSVSGGAPIRVPCTCRCTDEKTQREKTERRVRELRDMAFPSEKMKGYTFAAADADEHILIAKRYTEHWEEACKDGLGLLFYGNAGVGKSYATICVVNELIERYQTTARFLSAQEIVSNLLSRQVNREEYLARLCRYQVLVIDDVGAESDSGAAQSVLCDAIDARNESRKPTIFTTNYSLNEMERPSSPIHARIFDRVRQRTAPVRVVGKSHRREESDKLFGKWAGILKPGEGN